MSSIGEIGQHVHSQNLIQMGAISGGEGQRRGTCPGPTVAIISTGNISSILMQWEWFSM